jgi:hypothetical protein
MFFTADNVSAGQEVWALPLSALPNRVYAPMVWR